MEASVRELDDYFDVILYETCASEVFNIGGINNGPNTRTWLSS